MEEADLLKERLQAITDKRRVQEGIAKKRREIEEEKLKLQYLKKKALREQWLMDGTSPQNEQEEEAMRVQAEDNQQQTKLLQSSIGRIEREIEDLETQEMAISSNEELILKRLKEVEKTAEDIIKEVNADFQPESTQYIYSAIPDMLEPYTPTPLRRIFASEQEPNTEQSKRATFAMEINVEKDLRTGRSQVLSAARVTAQDLQQKGVKVYEDGRKTIYALSSDGYVMENGVDELSPVEVEELLEQATEKKLPPDVEYHDPVFSTPFSRPTTPRRSQTSPTYSGLHNFSESPSSFQAEPLEKDRPCAQSPWDSNLSSRHVPAPDDRDFSSSRHTHQCPSDGQEMCLISGGNGITKDRLSLSPSPSHLQEAEEWQRLTPVADSGVGLGGLSPGHYKEDSSRNLVNTIPSTLDSEPVTMIFMGYQNAESDEEDEGIQAELVVIGNDEDEDECDTEEDRREQSLSYHPEGCHSKIFQPNINNVYRSEVRPSGLRRHGTQDLPIAVRVPVSVVLSKAVLLVCAVAKHISLSILRSKRATTALKDEEEANKDICHSQNHTREDLEFLSEPVTMETTEQPVKERITDCETEPWDTELPERNDSNKDEEHIYYDTELLESVSAKVVVDILADLPPSMTAMDECEDAPCQNEALVLEGTNERLNRNESITSSISDTPSSAESVCENESMRKRLDSLKEEESAVSATGDVERGDIFDPLKPVSNEATLENFGCDEADESMLEQYIQDEALSDVSCHDQDDLDECLQVEIAAASSDSETDDKWRSIFSSSINKEDDDSYIDSLELSAQELFIQKLEPKNVENDTDKRETEMEIPAEEDVLEQPESDTNPKQLAQEISYSPSSLFHGLSKISEDEEEQGKGSGNHQNTSFESEKSETTKKVPRDYCVIQEMKSENVNTEHVDFRVARKQWLEMEEQTKHLAHHPTTKPAVCQGSHSIMYTPVRNIDRSRRGPDLENLALTGEYPPTQFSPCSEDSGLDDCSFKSPFDDPETPIDREIRLAMEREENLRRERGMSTSFSSDCVQAKDRQVAFYPTKLCQEVDEKRKMFEHQVDNCKIPRSPSNKTPSFIITSSPVKSPKPHEMAANNVIILEPDPPSPRRVVKDMGTTRCAGWKSEEAPNVIILETSNLIIRSASDFCLNSACEESSQEKTFLSNPFFKLRSRSTLSLVDEEIKMAKQREEELKKQRASVYTKDKFDMILVSPNPMDSLAFDQSDDLPVKCKSSPSSPLKTAYRMDRSTLSCDHRFPETYSGGRRKSAMALRWEAGEFANNE